MLLYREFKVQSHFKLLYQSEKPTCFEVPQTLLRVVQLKSVELL